MLVSRHQKWVATCLH